MRKTSRAPLNQGVRSLMKWIAAVDEEIDRRLFIMDGLTEVEIKIFEGYR
jgi:hypothetical protein